jgi:hypothetical protein
MATVNMASAATLFGHLGHPAVLLQFPRRGEALPVRAKTGQQAERQDWPGAWEAGEQVVVAMGGESFGQEGEQVDGGLFEADTDARFEVLLAQFQEPFPEGFRGGVDGQGALASGAGVDEVEVGLGVGTVQADDQVIGRR